MAESKATSETKRRNNLAIANKLKTFSVSVLVIGLVYALYLCIAPDQASAASNGSVSFNYMIKQLQYVTTVFLLPIAVIACAWKILYLALFGGLLGIDPLNQISDTNADGGINPEEVSGAIKGCLSGFVHGLCWVGGLFIIFQIAMLLASMLAAQLETNFG